MECETEREREGGRREWLTGRGVDSISRQCTLLLLSGYIAPSNFHLSKGVEVLDRFSLSLSLSLSVCMHACEGWPDLAPWHWSFLFCEIKKWAKRAVFLFFLFCENSGGRDELVGKISYRRFMEKILFLNFG